MASITKRSCVLEMGPRSENRSGALSTLKTALTRQFGESARSVVEAHVDATLGRTKGKIGREHIDEIEKAIMGTMREQRGSTRGPPTMKSMPTMSKSSPLMTKSAPSLPLGNLTGLSSTGAASLPPATPPVQTSQVKLPLGISLPSGLSNPGTVARAASSTALDPPKKKKPVRPAPYGMSITGAPGFEFIDDTARSGVKLQPRYPVPVRPKLKPMDHWDLMVAFDSQKYKKDEYELHTKGNYERQMRFKKTLDDQMIEVQGMRDNEAQGREEERLLMEAQVEENEKYKQEEEALIQKKKDLSQACNDSMLGDIQKYKDQEARRKKTEEQEVTAWLAEEKRKKDEDARNQAIEYNRKCEQAKADLEENRRLRAEKKRLEDENEIRLMKLRDQIADENEAKKQKALQDRKDHIERVSKTVGAAIADKDAQDAADLDAKIKRIQEEANRRSMEDARSRQDAHNAKVKDMVETRQRQVIERTALDHLEKEADQAMLRRMKKEYEEAVAEDNRKAEARRKAREDQDAELIANMRVNAGIHEQHVMMTPRNRSTELSYNKAIFEQMYKEGFRPDDVTATLTKKQGKPGFTHHPEGKLLPFPTIPRFTGEIHPLELDQPDV